LYRSFRVWAAIFRIFWRCCSGESFAIAKPAVNPATRTSAATALNLMNHSFHGEAAALLLQRVRFRKFGAPHC